MLTHANQSQLDISQSTNRPFDLTNGTDTGALASRNFSEWPGRPGPNKDFKRFLISVWNSCLRNGKKDGYFPIWVGGYSQTNPNRLWHWLQKKRFRKARRWMRKNLANDITPENKDDEIIKRVECAMHSFQLIQNTRLERDWLQEFYQFLTGTKYRPM